MKKNEDEARKHERQSVPSTKTLEQRERERREIERLMTGVNTYGRRSGKMRPRRTCGD